MTGTGLICSLPVKGTNGEMCVGIVLAQDAIFLTAEGVPRPGVALTPESARELANRMILIADRIEKSERMRH